MEASSSNRKIQYDLLRILAAFSVVMLHTAGMFWYDLPIDGREWRIVNAYDACSRFGVSIFVMVSGAIFLDPNRELDVKRLYRHNILRYGVIYVFWGAVYGLTDCLRLGFANLTWKQILKEILAGRYHLWFLPMLIGIYVLLPVLRSWILHAHKRNIQYFLALFVILQVLRTTIATFVRNEELLNLINLGEIQMACSYVGYFVLGYYIVHVGIPRRYHKLFYISVIPAAVLNILISEAQTARDGVANGCFYDSFGLFTFIIVLAVFIFFTQKVNSELLSTRGAAVIMEVSKGTLGIYMMHIGFMEQFKRMRFFGIFDVFSPVPVGVPLIALLIFLLCYVLAALLRRFPLVGRYIC